MRKVFHLLTQALFVATLLLSLSGCDGFSAPPSGARPGETHHGFFFGGQNDPTNLWSVIASDLELGHACEQPAVQRELQWYLHHEHFVERTAKRAQPYLYYIYHEIRKRRMPATITFLPLIESAYDPFAYSGVGAAGIWQMMPGTASGFGIRQNWWYDGRRDIFASTTAALNYLSYLSTFFNGDWLLALAAYDSGEGTVEQAVKKNARLGLRTDYWSLGLPTETRNYIPRLLGFACAVKQAHRYDFSIPYIADRPYLGTVNVGSQINLAKAAQMAGLPLNELYRLNPGFNRWATDPNGPHELILPLDKIEQFKRELVLLSPSERAKPTLLERHQKLNHYVIQATKQYVKDPNKLPGPKQVTHIVKRHETLAAIARRYEVDIRNLRFWNNMKPSAVAEPGQTLTLWLSDAKLKKLFAPPKKITKRASKKPRQALHPQKPLKPFVKKRP